MQMKYLKRLLGFFSLMMVITLLASCQGNKQSVGNQLSGDTIPLKYSQLLTMVRHDGYVEAIIANPWKEKQVLHRYLLIPKGNEGDKVVTKLQESNQMGGKGITSAVDIVRTPVSSSIITTAPHCQLLYELNAKKAITGVCDANYINIPDIKRYVDCGSSMQPDIERIIALHPEALVISPFENSGGYGKLDKLGIPVIEAADYMEASPLGRAEWIKFYAVLFGSEERRVKSEESYSLGESPFAWTKGDSLFSIIEHEYLSLKSKAAKLPEGLSVLTERKMGSVWYVPGGQSTMGILLRDAHAKYIFADDNHSGSLALSPEQIIAKGNQVDVWAFKYFGGKPLSCADLLQEYKGYQTLRAFEAKNIYECDTQILPYFEQTSFHPEILLREFILLSHPSLLNQQGWGQLRFYKKLKEL